jgi:RNA polymerase sigma-70 factor (ECF subfamily)
MGIPKKGVADSAMAEIELEAAVEAARGGDEMAFALLWRENNSRLTKFVQARTFKSDLDFEEIVAETWSNVAKDLKKFKGDYSGFTAWVYAIARNRIIDASRKRDRTIRPQSELDEASWIPSTQDIEKDFEADEKVKNIIAAINRLPEAQAEVLMLRVVSDLSVEEVAKIVKKNANAVRVLAHRGMATLKEELGGRDE